MLRRFGLIGTPLSHSYSQSFFTRLWARQGCADRVYELFDLPHIKAFPELLKNYPDLIGCNVTIPYKKAILSYVTDRDAVVAETGAANCLCIGAGFCRAYNTDALALLKVLRPYRDAQVRSALILGTGGAAQAAAYVLRKMGIHFQHVSRKQGSALTYACLDKTLIRQTQWIINATPVGMYPNVADCPDIPYEALSVRHFCYDLIYNPKQTLFLQKAAAQGAHILNGYSMLVQQALYSLKIWCQNFNILLVVCFLYLRMCCYKM